MNYRGYDILRAEDVSSAEECQTVCAGHPGCGYFSYTEETRLCHLKHPQALTGRVLSDYHTSGAACCREYNLGTTIGKGFFFGAPSLENLFS